MRRRVLIGLGAVALAGCGFELRQPLEMPFRTIALVGFPPHSPLADELRRSLGDQVEVVDNPDRADVVLRVLLERRERSVVASTASAQVRQLQLRLRFNFELTDPGGRELGPATELLLSRDMSYSETYALAKAQEEDELFAAMQSDVVRQVTRRLAQVQLQPAKSHAS
jgi:LPS-assembly lipoprotein